MIKIKQSCTGSPCISIKISQTDNSSKLSEFLKLAIEKGIFIELVSSTRGHLIYNISIDDEDEWLEKIHNELMQLYE